MHVKLSDDFMGPGIKEIAEECGVSVHTVSDIINRKRDRGYSAATIERVVEASRRLNYRPNRAAQAMRSRKTREIGFAARNFSPSGELENYVVYPFVVGLSHGLTEHGYHVSLVELEELEFDDSGALPAIFEEHRFDGLIINYGLSPQAVSRLPAFDTPVLWWDSGIMGAQNCLYRDESEVARRVTRELIQRGHRNIAFMAGERGWQTYLEGGAAHFSLVHRYQSYRDEMRAQGLRDAVLTGYDIAAMATQLRGLATTAVVMRGASELAFLSQVAHRLQLTIPDDLSVVACDREARHPTRGFLVGGMSYDRYDAGQQAAAMMLATLRAPKKPMASRVLLGDFEAGDTLAHATQC